MMLITTVRKTTLGLAALSLSAWGILTLVSEDSNPAASVPTYAPRTEMPAAQPDGSMEIRRMLVGDANGNIDYAGLQSLRKEVIKAAQKQGALKANSLSWHELGPDNIGGRTRAIAAVGNNTLYAGAVSGGLWKSTNRGDNWNQIVSFPSLMVGSIAIAGNGTIYVGTGSNFDGAGGEGGSGFRGDGIWMSTDNGASFEMVDGTSATTQPTRLLRIPQPNRVWYASMDGYGSITEGIISEVPGGANSPSNATDVAIAPDGSYCLVAGATEGYTAHKAAISRIWWPSLKALVKMATSAKWHWTRAHRHRPKASTDGTYNAFAMYATRRFVLGLFFSDGAGEGGTWRKSGLEKFKRPPRSRDHKGFMTSPSASPRTTQLWRTLVALKCGDLVEPAGRTSCRSFRCARLFVRCSRRYPRDSFRR